MPAPLPGDPDRARFSLHVAYAGLTAEGLRHLIEEPLRYAVTGAAPTFTVGLDSPLPATSAIVEHDGDGQRLTVTAGSARFVFSVARLVRDRGSRQRQV